MVVPNGVWGGDNDGGNAWTNSGMGTSIAGHWGNPGINDGANGGPEYRRYSWIDNTTTSKVAYTAYIMTGATTGGSVVPATTKIYIKIEQVTGL